ncbi:uncharacterized protein LOC126380569 isoform X2 [Pectinophora gossypiella]|uniref:BTB domain-containing protein n=1 Tax=Pectinophora gossypiella TaxID=13191 RepID=A0A1E1WIA4_PECGO|nr:uncharacterized protein LOC126380569 isoform X2 [Pectinophora gossypiella]
MMIGDGEYPGPMPEEDVRPPPPEYQRPLSEDHSGPGAISAINRITTKRAKRLYLYDVGFKLKHNEIYDVGGTYTDVDTKPHLVPDLWFFFSTTTCPGHNYLLNLFVCHRRAGNFSIGIANSGEMVHKKKSNDRPGHSWMPDTLTWHSYRTSKPDENYHIKTYCFSEADLKNLENNTLVIPIRIDMDTMNTLNNDVIKQIKLNHDFSDILAKAEKADFTLISASKRQFPVHRIFLAAHSSVLRDIIKNQTEDKQAFLDISDNDMELLLEFIYTGTIKDILKKDCLTLLQIADRFQLHNLFFLTQFALVNQINVNNAVHIACMAEKYKLDKLQSMVFNFIKNNPKVLETDGWRDLDDVNLAKKLFQFMHTKKD